MSFVKSLLTERLKELKGRLKEYDRTVKQNLYVIEEYKVLILETTVKIREIEQSLENMDG